MFVLVFILGSGFLCLGSVNLEWFKGCIFLYRLKNAEGNLPWVLNKLRQVAGAESS